jgi:hypothetical protein
VLQVRLQEAKAGELRVNASGLMFDGHHQPVPADVMPRRFLLEHTCKLDKPKGKSTTSVLKGISDDLEAFYGNVVEHLVGYVAPAPKLPKEHAASSNDQAIAIPAPAEAPSAPTTYPDDAPTATSPVVTVLEPKDVALEASLAAADAHEPDERAG